MVGPEEQNVKEKVTEEELKKALPSLSETPSPSKDALVGLYTMFYRHNSNHLQTKNFRFHGPLQAARARAEAHCKIMGYRINFVQPMISDLKTEEEHFRAVGGEVQTVVRGERNVEFT